MEIYSQALKFEQKNIWLPLWDTVYNGIDFYIIMTDLNRQAIVTTIVNRYLQIAEQPLISAPSTRRNRQWLTLNLVWCTLAELTVGQNF